MNDLLQKEKETLHSVSAVGFISYVVYIIARITVVFIVQGWLVSTWGLIWFYSEAVLVALGVLFGVRKASMITLVKNIRRALADGKISRDEAWGLMRETFFVILGNWSDIIPANGLQQIDKKEEKKEKIDEIE